jgi:hypothetical protein
MNMELDDMKRAWAEVSTQLEKQKQLNDKLIMDMTQQKYKTQLDKIRSSESTAAILAIAFVAIIAFNFDKYDTFLVRISAIITAMGLIIPCYISLRSIRRMQSIDITGNYRELMTRYTQAKHSFLSLQKLNLVLGAVLLITGLPVMLRVFGADTNKLKPEIWLWYLPGAYIFFAIFGTWVYRYYARVASRAEELLKDLEEG